MPRRPKNHEAIDDPQLSTGQVAQMLNVSRQHVVDLCNRGDLPFESTGTHRRVRRSDVLALRRRGTQHGTLSRDQLRSLWLHRAVAGKLVMDPVGIVRVAHRNLQTLCLAHPRGQAARWLREWARLLDGPTEDVLDALTSRSQRGIELRQNSPFAGALTERERTRVLEGFAREVPSAA